MATKIKTKKPSPVIKEEKKRPYSRDVKAKLDAGEDWILGGVKLDNDVARKVYEEKMATPNGGGQYIRIINSRLRKSYGIKAKK